MKQNKGRILVTGGAGFIGSHSVEHLLANQYEVIVLDNLLSGSLKNLPLNHPNLEFIEGDILDYHLLLDILKTCHAVLHLAAIPSVPLSINDPLYTSQVNLQGFLHLIEAIHQTNSFIRLVYASSAAVYGHAHHLPCRDDEPVISQPLSPYALQKIQNEQYAMLYQKLHQISCLGLRYFNVYGKRQDPSSPYSGVISRFINAYQANQTLTIYGDGKQSRDFIAVTDIARANLLALENKASGVMNIATGEAQTLLNLIDYLQEAGDTPAKIHFEPARTGDIDHSYAAIETAKIHLGFKSHLSLKEGIRQLLQHSIVEK